MSLESRLYDALRPWRNAPSWCVALSGGLDSTVLLHALVRLASRHALPPISAIHIHHGLQVAADAWPVHCEAVCQQLGVRLEVVNVQVGAGASLERLARDARYAAFRAALEPSGILLTGQHRDDQAETVLFRLMRGAGVRGLAGMPVSRPLGTGSLVRPLLGFGRVELQAYAQAEGLQWVEDPSNSCLDHSRNYLRHHVVPTIRQRWPSAPTSIARAAEHLAEADGLLGELAALDLSAAQSQPDHAWLPLPSLALQALRDISPARQRNALRHWLSPLTSLPDTDHWAGWDALREASPDAAPVWRLANGELHRGAGRIWWLSGPWLDSPEASVEWPAPAQELSLPGNGSVRLLGACSSSTTQIRYRQGGESLQLPRRGRRDLKRLLNEAEVPGFVRARLPLLYMDGELVAVANLPQFDTQGLSLNWIPPGDGRFELMGSFQ